MACLLTFRLHPIRVTHKRCPYTLNTHTMTEQEPREMFLLLEAQGLHP